MSVVPVEIRYNTKRLLVISGLALAGYAAMMYYVFFSGKVKYTDLLLVLSVILAIMMIWGLYPLVKMIRSGLPALVFAGDSLTHHGRKPFTLLWSQLTGWSTENDEGTIFITMQTTEGGKRLNISNLEKKPSEIIALFTEFSGKEASK